MSASTLITDGFGSFGNIARIVMLGLYPGDAVIPPEPPEALVTGGGGYVGYDHYKRKKSVDEERKKLGIIPKAVKKAIKAVVKENIAYGSGDKAEQELKIELQRRDIAYKQNYAVALEAYRDQMVALEIYRLMKIKQAKDDQDDDDAAIMLLM